MGTTTDDTGARDALVEVVRERAGDALRSVSVRDERTVTVRYLRDDIEDRYDRAELREVADELFLAGLSDGYHRSLYRMGGLRFEARGFETGKAVRVPLSERADLFFTVDADAALDLHAVAEAAREAHRSGVGAGEPVVSLPSGPPSD
jgi:hypothetical protein